MDDDTTTEPAADGGEATDGPGLVERLWTIDSRRFDVAFTVVLWLFIGTLIVYSFDLKPTARHVPLVVAVPTFLILSVILVMLLSERVSEFADAITDTEAFGADETELPGSDVASADDQEEELSLVDRRKRIAYALGSVLGLFALVYVVGFYVAIPVFLVAVYRWKADRSWAVSIVTAALIWVFVIIVFHMLLSVRLFPGILDIELTPYFPF